MSDTRKRPPFATSTGAILNQALRTPNPVTRSVLLQIAGNRIDSAVVRSAPATKEAANV